jgi:hypothetical protein
LRNFFLHEQDRAVDQARSRADEIDDGRGDVVGKIGYEAARLWELGKYRGEVDAENIGAEEFGLRGGFFERLAGAPIEVDGDDRRLRDKSLRQHAWAGADFEYSGGRRAGSGYGVHDRSACQPMLAERLLLEELVAPYELLKDGSVG